MRELLYVPGPLKGQGRTQIFLRTQDGSGAAITVKRYPGTAPIWGVSFSELVAGFGDAPLPGTIEWYRLACFLPRHLPGGADLSATAAAGRQAVADYQLVLNALGPCLRTRANGPGNSAARTPPRAGSEAPRLSNASQSKPRRDPISPAQGIPDRGSPDPAGRPAAQRWRRVHFDKPDVVKCTSVA